MDFELRSKSWLDKKGVLKAVEAASIAPLAKCAFAVEGFVKRSLSRGGKRIAMAQFGDKTARFIYESGEPGKPPRLRTGNLRNSIRTAKTSEGTFVVGPTTTAWYGRVQEFGALIPVTAKMRGFLLHEFGWRVGKNAIYIPPRPFMRPGLEGAMQQFPQFFKGLKLKGPEK